MVVGAKYSRTCNPTPHTRPNGAWSSATAQMMFICERSTHQNAESITKGEINATQFLPDVQRQL